MIDKNEPFQWWIIELKYDRHFREDFIRLLFFFRVISDLLNRKLVKPPLNAF